MEWGTSFPCISPGEGPRGVSGNGHCNLPANIPAGTEANVMRPIAFDFIRLTPARVGPEFARPQGDGYRPSGI